MLYRINLMLAVACLFLLGTTNVSVASAKGAVGTLRIHFTGKSFQQLNVIRVEPLITGVKWDGKSLDNPAPDEDIVVNIQAGKYMLSLLVVGAFRYSFDVGSVTIRQDEEVVENVDLSQFMGAIRFEATDTSLLKKASMWLYHPDRDNRFDAFAKYAVPKGGVFENVPATRMWMVVVDENKVPIQAQFIHPNHGQQTRIRLSKVIQKNKFPVRVRLRLRTDSVKESDLSFRLSGSQSNDFKQSRAGEFYTAVQPGFYRIRVSNKGKEHSSSGFFIMNEPAEMILVVDGPDKMRFCNSQDMKRASDLFRNGEKLMKASRLEDALLFYDLSNECMTDNRAPRRVIEVGQQLAAKAEKNKRYFARSTALYAAKPDSGCLGPMDVYPAKGRGVCVFEQMIVSKPEAGGIEWLTAIESPQAGRMAVRYIQSIPAGDPKALLLTPDFFDEGMLDRIKESVSSIRDVALQKEDEMFRRSQDSTVEIAIDDPGKAAFAWLEIASTWAGNLGQAKQEAVRRHAGQRGGTLKQGVTPQALATAIDYYEFAHDQQSVTSTRQRAGELGHQHLQQGDTTIAAGFFSVAGDDAAAQRVEEARKAVSQREKARLEKRKKKFMSEMETLEEDLDF